MDTKTHAITKLILDAAERAGRETSDEPELELVGPAQWPIQCTVGPGLEGAIACESKVGYVNGAKGWLVYRGYNVFDLCAHSNFEEVCYLLLHGKLPNREEFEAFRRKLIEYRYMNPTLRLLMGFPLENMNAMSALRMGANMMRQEFTHLDEKTGQPSSVDVIGADEDSIAMETAPKGERQAIYEFKKRGKRKRTKFRRNLDEGVSVEACYHLISGVATIAAAIARIHQGAMPIDPDPELSHAANFLYMMTGRRPTPSEERIMDIALILHADHGMNASTFAAMVVASTLSDLYFSVGSGIAALNGPLHGGANEHVIHVLEEIGSPDNVSAWLDETLAKREKVVGFGHRVYRAYDPRARVLGPLAKKLVGKDGDAERLYRTARALEKEAVARLGNEKKIFPNVDFYSGLVYTCLGIDTEMFTPIFAVSRVAGWTARVLEYIQNNRIFRPRARYIGDMGLAYSPLDER